MTQGSTAPFCPDLALSIIIIIIIFTGALRRPE
jgi:hypothetical protein